MARPSPVPPSLPVVNGSNNRAAMRSGSGGPLFAIITRATPGTWRVRITTRRSLGLACNASRALAKMFKNTDRKCRSSPGTAASSGSACEVMVIPAASSNSAWLSTTSASRRLRSTATGSGRAGRANERNDWTMACRLRPLSVIRWSRFSTRARATGSGMATRFWVVRSSAFSSITPSGFFSSWTKAPAIRPSSAKPSASSGSEKPLGLGMVAKCARVVRGGFDSAPQNQSSLPSGFLIISFEITQLAPD